MGGCNFVNHAAGWLEGGLVASFEKLIVDVEMLTMMAILTEPIDVSDETLALDVIADIGPGGHFLGTEHTRERYRGAFHTPLVSDWRIYDSWRADGEKTAMQRANEIWKSTLSEYQSPALDPSIQEALEDYVAKRKEEIGS